MTEAEQRLESQIKCYEQTQDISTEDKQLLGSKFQNYIDLLKRRGAANPYTQCKYLKHLRRILEQTDWELSQLAESDQDQLRKVNQEMADMIQNAYFKHQSGDYMKKTKKDQWLAWKRALQVADIETDKHRAHIPNPSFTSDRSQVDNTVDTQPSELPTPQETRRFTRALWSVSPDKCRWRNITIPLLIYDTGMRKGELQSLKVGDVTVNNGRAWIQVTGNKGADDREVEVFQARKTLMNYLEQHPRTNDPDAYLFGRDYRDNWQDRVSLSPGVKNKMFQARRKAGLENEIKLEDEPFHIWRKAYHTVYVVNEILTWEKVCTRVGKKPDATKPDYLLQALSDVDASAAEGFGLESEDRDYDTVMKDDSLLPQKCRKCGQENMCWKEVCTDCSTELEHGAMPKGRPGEQSNAVNPDNALEMLKNMDPGKLKEILDQ